MGEKTSVRFQALGRAYDTDVVKEKTVTRMGGDGWKQFVAQNHLSGGDQMIVFSLRGCTPRMSVIYFSGGEEDPYDKTIISQICNMSDDEQRHLLDIIPAANTFVGVLFVTRLTKSNLAKHSMVRLFNLVVYSFLICVYNLRQFSHIVAYFFLFVHRNYLAK